MLAVKTTDLTKKYGKYYGIDNVNLAVEKGETFGIVGPLGAGKTTLLRLLMNLIFPSAGSANIFGNDVVTDATLIKETLGYVPEVVTCYPQMKAGKYIKMSMKLHGVKNNEAMYRLMEAFAIPKNETFDVMDNCDIKATGIVAALAIEPKILLLDDVTADLTRDMQETLFQLLAAEKAKGTTIIMTGDSLDDLGGICDRVATIEDGSIVCIKDAKGAVMTDIAAEQENFADEYEEYSEEDEAIDELADTILIEDLPETGSESEPTEEQTEPEVEVRAPEGQPELAEPVEETIPLVTPVADIPVDIPSEAEPAYAETSIEDFLAEPDESPAPTIVPEGPEEPEEEDTVNPKVLKIKAKNIPIEDFENMGMAIVAQEKNKIKLAYAGNLDDLASKLQALGLTNYTTSNKNIAKALGIKLPENAATAESAQEAVATEAPTEAAVDDSSALSGETQEAVGEVPEAPAVDEEVTEEQQGGEEK